MERVLHILLAGCGKMGSALLQGWLDRLPDVSVTVIDPHSAPPQASSDARIRYLASISGLEDDVAPSLLVLAVKPQTMDEACRDLKAKLVGGTPVLSIAAGKSLSYFASAFGAGAPVIRSMPNTPAAIGHGMTVACANGLVTSPVRALAETLLGAVGRVEWIEDESLMDAVTAVSGSGPAYVFLLIEEMAKAGIAAGLPGELAMTLARQTVIGSAALAGQNPAMTATVLREAVTSPKGTTEAALNVLMAEDGLSPLMQKAVAAATRRSRDLAA